MADENRVRVESDGDGVKVRMPGPRGRWRVAVLVLFLPLAAYVVLGNAVLVRTAIASTQLDPLATSAAIWAVTVVLLLLVDIPVLVAAVVLAYQLTGRETVCASPWMLSDERRVLGILPYRRSWAAMHVSHLRLAPHSGGPADPAFLGRRGVLFDVEGKRVRGIAEGCTPQEAAEVLEAVDAAIHAPTITR